MTAPSHTAPPWYKQFWPWFLIFFPFSAVVGGIATIIIAVNNKDSLVVDDYYESGLAINQSLKKDRTAVTLSIQAELKIDLLSKQITATISGKSSPAKNLTLNLIHPTTPTKDQHFTLSEVTRNRFSGYIETLEPGQWKIVLEDDQHHWRLVDTARLPTALPIHLAPNN